MAVRVGTSGYSYTAWKGSFFPADLASSQMLEFYAQKLSTVEINNTFYRMPTSAALADCAEETSHFLRLASELDEKLGPLLFQLPPFMKKDLTRLRDFLASLPKSFASAFEFRHDSWMDDQVFEALREKNAALCIADTDEKEGQVIRTAKWGYLRLRRSDYSADSLASWAKRITGEWTQTYVYFKHEEEGKGPKFAMDFEAAVKQAG